MTDLDLFWCTVVLKTSLGAYLVLAAAAKVVHGPDELIQSLADYSFLPRGSHPLLGVALIGIELGLGLCLLVGPAAPAALFAGALLCLFAFVVLVEVARGRRHACGCFGSQSARVVGFGLIAQNILLAWAAAFISWREFTYGSATWGELSGLDAFLAALVTTATVAALALWSEAEGASVAFAQWLETYTAASAQLDRGHETERRTS